MTPKGKVYPSGEVVYACANYRANSACISLPGACSPHVGQIIADLYDEHGKFHRCAVVADLGNCGSYTIQKYVEEQNAASQRLL